jgi:predicted nucleotidyltransferase component of viral defense system
MQQLATRHKLELKQRSWGDTESFELLTANDAKLFSFQIASRSVALDPPLDSAWQPVKIESFRDNLGSKMNALVNRGAPRDFLDVHEICNAGLATVKECWDTWQLKNKEQDLHQAKANIARHLELLERRRPVGSITSAAERKRAIMLREWVSNKFLTLAKP